MLHFSYTEAGYNHENEDCIAVQAHSDAPNAFICVLADGQGGQLGGAAAAQMAVQKTLELAATRSIKQLLNRKTWLEIICSVDSEVAEAENAGFTTLVAVCVFKDRVYGASCGDSATLLVNQSNHIILTEKQRKNPPIGSNAAIPVGFEAKLKNSSLILMSDGVWKYVGHEKIAETSRDLKAQELISKLKTIQLEQNNGKLQDDFSIILLHQ